MYDPDSDETYLDMNDIATVMKSKNARMAATQIVKQSTYLTEVNVPDWQNEIEKELSEQQCKDLKIDNMIPLDKYPNGEFGIRWCNIKYVVKQLMDYIINDTHQSTTGKPHDGKHAVKDGLPCVSGKTAIESVSHRDNLNGRIDAMRKRDNKLSSDKILLQTAPTFDDGRKTASKTLGKKKSDRISLKHKTMNNFLPDC